MRIGRPKNTWEGMDTSNMELVLNVTIVLCVITRNSRTVIYKAIMLQTNISVISVIFVVIAMPKIPNWFNKITTTSSDKYITKIER